MSTLTTSARSVLIAGILAAAAAPSIARHSVANEPEPTLEIFSNQQPILIGRGQPKTLSLLGAVYDGDIRFDGKVFIRPNGPAATACPIFSNGDNFNVSVVRNSTNVPFQLQVLVPQNHPLGTYNCKLTYSATQTNPATGEVVPIATKGNEVGFQYTVKNRFVF